MRRQWLPLQHTIVVIVPKHCFCMLRSQGSCFCNSLPIVSELTEGNCMQCITFCEDSNDWHCKMLSIPSKHNPSLSFPVSHSEKKISSATVISLWCPLIRMQYLKLTLLECVEIDTNSDLDHIVCRCSDRLWALARSSMNNWTWQFICATSLKTTGIMENKVLIASEWYFMVDVVLPMLLLIVNNSTCWRNATHSKGSPHINVDLKGSVSAQWSVYDNPTPWLHFYPADHEQLGTPLSCRLSGGWWFYQHRHVQ